jgi:hypothetical protein
MSQRCQALNSRIMIYRSSRQLWDDNVVHFDHRPVKTIFGGSIPFLIASARAVRPRRASSELWRAMVTSRIIASAEGIPPPDHASVVTERVSNAGF